jgi:mono/diheme cytochrome c family protein
MHPGRFASVLAVLVSSQGLLHSGLSKGETTNLPPPAQADIAPPVPPSAEQLAWDALIKEHAAKAGETEAKFFFSATNISASDAIIERVQTSCGCTIAEIPSQPWILKPHEDGKINVTVNFAGKSGTIFKSITVYFSSGDPKLLTIKLVLPENGQMQRLRNQQIAMMDRQKVFQDNACAHCHADPTRGKTGQELFAAACSICHESEHRATMVPDLHALNHPTDKTYWKQWITTGKPGSLMPGFGAELGGPLDSKQINSLVDYLWDSIPHGVPSPSGKPGSVVPGPVLNQPWIPPVK